MKIESEFFNKISLIEWETVTDKIQRKIMGYNNEIMMVQVKFDKGGIGVRHEHHHSQTTYVASGKFKVTISNNTEILSAGDGFYIPPHVYHGAVCLEDGILIDVFSPAREDFLENKFHAVKKT